jgi:hypothetical protein
MVNAQPLGDFLRRKRNLLDGRKLETTPLYEINGSKVKRKTDYKLDEQKGFGNMYSYNKNGSRKYNKYGQAVISRSGQAAPRTRRR